MKLTYWTAPVLDDSPCYNLREKTRKACAERRMEEGAERYGPPVKVTLEYRDAFDLMDQLTQEGGPAAPHY